MSLLPQFTLLLDLPFVDPTQSLAFPMNVIALLPYLLLHYEDANELCIMSAENIAQVKLTTELSPFFLSHLQPNSYRQIVSNFFFFFFSPSSPRPQQIKARSWKTWPL